MSLPGWRRDARSLVLASIHARVSPNHCLERPVWVGNEGAVVVVDLSAVGALG
jgi:hypothetical protein